MAAPRPCLGPRKVDALRIGFGNVSVGNSGNCFNPSVSPRALIPRKLDERIENEPRRASRVGTRSEGPPSTTSRKYRKFAETTISTLRQEVNRGVIPEPVIRVITQEPPRHPLRALIYGVARSLCHSTAPRRPPPYPLRSFHDYSFGPRRRNLGIVVNVLGEFRYRVDRRDGRISADGW